MSQKAYQVITDRIIELLEKGTCPWRKPWQTTEAQNAISKKPYQGINSLLLNSLAYESPYWLTFNQAKKLGGSVKKGERGFPVIFWKFLEKEDEETKEKKKIPLLRYYTVFNATQCEGIEDKLPKAESAKQEIIPDVSIVENYLERESSLSVNHGGNIAAYNPRTDTVQMPTKESFESADSYSSTFFHEMVHSTGAKKRLARFDNPDQFQFESDSYSKEELIAEMGAAFLCDKAGISREIENSVAYLNSWLNTLRQPKNSKLIICAAGKAQKAVKYILEEKE